MKLKVKYFVLTAVFCFFSLFIFAQMQHPPEPRMQDGGGTPGDGPPCADQVDDGTGGDVPPPPGGCLSINEYLYPLMILGLLFGAYRVIKIENANKALEGK